MNIAIIPARGGSKRIPRKNVKMFCDRPMISYAITAAIDSTLFDHVVVSTEDDEIAQIALAYGAEIPFARPIELASDYTETVPVVVHAIEMCRKQGWMFDNVCCIYPCVPLIHTADISEALLSLKNSDADYCFSVTQYASPVQRALKRLKNGSIRPLYPEFELTRTQDLDLAYYDAGQFYWGKTEAWLTNPRIRGNSLGFLIPNWRAIDIDTEDDWTRAEIMADVLMRLRDRE